MSKKIMQNNSELLETFRQVIDGEIDLPPKVTNKLVLAAIVDTRIAVRAINEDVDEHCRISQEAIDQVNDQIEEIRTNELPHLAAAIKRVEDLQNENPSVLWLFRYKTNKTVKFFLGLLVAIITIIYIVSAVPAVQRIIAAILGLE